MLNQLFRSNKIRFPIAGKLGLILLVVFIALSTVDYLLIKRLNDVETSFSNVLSISSNAIGVLEINKDVAELQKNIAAYSQSGNQAIYDKMTRSFNSMLSRLNIVGSLSNEPQFVEVIDKMQIVIERYGNNLSNVRLRQESKQKLIEEDIPALIDKGIQVISGLNTELDTISDKLVMSQVLIEWYQIGQSANLYLLHKKYRERKKINQSIATIDTLLNTLSDDFRLANQAVITQVSTMPQDFDALFQRAVQANRHYLTLTNVVMAGDAAEFTNLAKILREESMNSLDNIKHHAKQTVFETNEIGQYIVYIGIIAFVCFGLFLHLYISKALASLTRTFNAFIRGDFSAHVEGTQRLDEIGVLAQAANEFKTVSQALIKAKQAAETTTKIKSEFLANMSHEIRTPMNGVLGMVELLSRTQLDDEQKKMLRIVESSGKSLLVLLNDILDLSKIESDKLVLESTPFDIRQIASDLRHLFSPLAEQKDIALNVSVVGNACKSGVMGDVTRIKQVLMNLIGNAIKFTETGGVTLSINCEPNGASTLVSFAVSDTGIGISQANISQLFEAFTQADTSITRRFGGTGLGLSISQKLITLMGSKLEVESEEGVGSTFSFTLSFESLSTGLVAGEAKLDKTIKDEIVIAKTSEEAQTINILVAEDNPVNQLVIEDMLRSLGYNNITVVENGLNALEQCQIASFDIILMDMQMPEMDGIEATIKIRQLPNYQTTKIIALTANAFAEDKQACFEAGMDDFLAKPVDRATLSVALSSPTGSARN